jgi:beta-fructofuranosidase
LNLDAIRIPVAFLPEPDLPVEIRRYDFESGDLAGWTTYGDAFSHAGVTDQSCYWAECFSFEHQGIYHFWGYNAGGDSPVGEMHSDSFILSGDGIIDLLIGGGNDINNLYLALVDANTHQELAKVTGNNSETFTQKQLNGSAFIGRECYLKAVDNSSGGFGHINLDDIRVPVVPQ